MSDSASSISVSDAFTAGLDDHRNRKEVQQKADVSRHQFYRSLEKIRAAAREVFCEGECAAC